MVDTSDMSRGRDREAEEPAGAEEGREGGRERERGRRGREGREGDLQHSLSVWMSSLFLFLYFSPHFYNDHLIVCNLKEGTPPPSLILAWSSSTRYIQIDMMIHVYV